MEGYSWARGRGETVTQLHMAHVSPCPVFSSPHYCCPLWHLSMDSQLPYLLIPQSLGPRVQAPTLQRGSKPPSRTRKQVTLGSKKKPRDVTGGVRGPAPSLAVLQFSPPMPSLSHQSAHTRLFLTPGPLVSPQSPQSPWCEPYCGPGVPRQAFCLPSGWADTHPSAPSLG